MERIVPRLRLTRLAPEDGFGLLNSWEARGRSGE